MNVNKNCMPSQLYKKKIVKHYINNPTKKPLAVEIKLGEFISI